MKPRPRSEWGTLLTEPHRYGRSHLGLPLEVWRPSGKCRLLLFAGLHGEEPETVYALSRALRQLTARPKDCAVVLAANPDGLIRGTRANARGVDLNRNFPSKTWVNQGKGTRYWSGPRPASEPETRAIVRFFSKLKPQTIISLHQPLASVDFSGGDEDVTLWLSRNLDLPKSHIHISGGGTMSSWYNAAFPLQTAVSVELPPGTTPQYRANVADVLVTHAKHRRR